MGRPTTVTLYMQLGTRCVQHGIAEEMPKDYGCQSCGSAVIFTMKGMSRVEYAHQRGRYRIKVVPAAEVRTVEEAIQPQTECSTPCLKPRGGNWRCLNNSPREARHFSSLQVTNTITPVSS